MPAFKLKPEAQERLNTMFVGNLLFAPSSEFVIEQLARLGIVITLDDLIPVQTGAFYPGFEPPDWKDD